MKLKRSVRILKKVQVDGRWKFASLKRNGKRYVWDERPGAYFLDWWDSGKRRRQFAWETASQALTAQKRKKTRSSGIWSPEQGSRLSVVKSFRNIQIITARSEAEGWTQRTSVSHLHHGSGKFRLGCTEYPWRLRKLGSEISKPVPDSAT